MVTIQIEPADNGVMKFLIDDNVNGGGEEYTTRTVYEFDGIVGRSNQVKFLKDLILDLGMVVGNELDKDKISIQTEWGNQYNPTEVELQTKVSLLEKELKKMRSLLKK